MSNQNDVSSAADRDGNGLPTAATSNQSVQYVDENGNPVEFVDENGNPVDLVDEYGNPIEYVDEDGNPISFDLVRGSGAGSEQPVDQTAQLESIVGASDGNENWGADSATAADQLDTPAVAGDLSAVSPVAESGVEATPTVNLPVQRESILPNAAATANATNSQAEATAALPTAVDAESLGDSPLNSDPDELESTATRRSAFLSSEPAPAETPVEEEDGPKWRLPSETDGDELVKTDLRALTLEDAMLDGATVEPSAPSRVAAHLWVLLLSLLGVPLSWYLLSDVSTRLRNPDLSPWIKGGGVNPSILTEAVFAFVLVFVVVWAARFSSLGTFVMGLVATVAGAPFVFAPAMTKAAITPMLKALQTAAEGNHFYQALPANLAHHIDVTGSNGLLFTLGISLLALGFVSHGARRKGRQDFLIDEKIKSKKRRKAALAGD